MKESGWQLISRNNYKRVTTRKIANVLVEQETVPNRRL